MGFIFNIIYLITAFFSRIKEIIFNLLGVGDDLKSADFKKLIKDDFSPLMHKHGFSGSGFHYYLQTKEHYIYTLIIQPNRYGGSCRIEVGVHLDFLPDTIGKYPPARELEPCDCYIRWQLGPNFSFSGWWKYGNSAIKAKKSIRQMMQTVKEDILPFFKFFSGFPQPLLTIKPQDLEHNLSNLKKIYDCWPSDVVLALLLAEFHLYLKNLEQAKAFAKWGLDHVYYPPGPGSGLIKDFEAILRKKDCA